MAAKAKAAAKRAAAAKKPNPSAKTGTPKAFLVAQHDPSRPPPLEIQDQTIFKQILHLYEAKSYALALKHCDTLLAKYPGHGETTAMAGLLQHSLNNKAQGYTLVKAGMKADLKSHIVWHVYGLMTRADRNYHEAVKSYTQALRLDPENHSILRDLAMLQIQVRQYGSYVESRWKLLRANRRSRTAWLSLAMAYVLNKQNDAALEILDAMESYEVVYEPERSFERSEMIFFKASILSTSNALQYLERNSHLVLDRSRYLLMRARCLGELGRQEASEWAWLDLLDSNDENRSYLDGYLLNQAKSENDSPLDALQRLSKRFPTSQMIRRSILDHSFGNQFEKELESYLATRLIKGIPSIFNDLKPLMVDSSKLLIIKTVTEQFHESFLQHQHLQPNETSEEDPPSTLVWLLHFLSQLYATPHLNMIDEALETIQKAINHTPCLPDLYITLARIYKRAGSFEKAADTLRLARELDGQDRYLNSKCAKYLLQSIVPGEHQTIQTRTQLLKESRRLVGLFTRTDAPDPVSDLVDMQAVWYVTAEAEAAFRVSDWGLSLKRFHQVIEIFRQWEEDQYDFHIYSIRKSTFQAYLNLLEFEDSLYTRPHYYNAISKAIWIYLQLHDRISSSSSDIIPTTEYNILIPPSSIEKTKVDLDSNEKDDKIEESTMSKKAMKKAKMAEIKAKAQAALEAKKATSKTKANDQSNSSAPDVIPPIKDEDPTGEKLVKTDRPLEMATDLLKTVEDQITRKGDPTDSTKRLLCKGVFLLRFEIEFRKDKPLLALKGLLKAQSFSSDHRYIDPEVFVALTKLKAKYLNKACSHENVSPESQIIANVLTVGFKELVELELLTGTQGHLMKAKALVAERLLNPSKDFSLEPIEAHVFSLITESSLPHWTVALQGLRLLKDCKSARVMEFNEKAGIIWKMVDEFRSSPKFNGLYPIQGDQSAEIKDF
ncbi:hypothetical protein O181_022483 [Austropuccinia psidii MF-1]|uniref:Uncharacterized protein n=1 Tax=Austropuccinia psidii MF-1 TaxID=1389203 RepID=A0A9Q3GWE0_9BASI|nr:hypothetical protein [Austropuccinia psidii MF-1]